MAKARGKVNDRQRRLIDEYLIDLNATQAAIRAGYSAKTADRIGAEILGKPWVKDELRKRLEARSRRTEITADRVLQEYARIAFFDPRKLFDAEGNPKPISELDADTAAAIAGLDVVQDFSREGIASYTKKYRLANKIGALDSVARHLGLFTEKKPEEDTEESGVVEIPAVDPDA